MAYDFLKLNSVMLPIFFRINFRALKYFYVIDIHDVAYKANPLEGFAIKEFLPYIISLLVFLFIVIKNSKKIKETFKIDTRTKLQLSLIITIIISILPFLLMMINGRQIYARYLIFSLPLIYLVIASYKLNLNNKLSTKIIIFILLISPNLFSKPKYVIYLDLQNSRSINDKVTSHGKYGNFILFFSDLYDWHTFYLRDYKIENNFKLFTFLKSCDEDTMDRALKMAGQNAFFVNYYKDCPELKDYILNNCEKYNSKCYDLGAQDGDVILKIFEPETQNENIQQLEQKYNTSDTTESTR